MTAIAGDGTAMERDYDFSSALHACDLEAAERSAAAPANARSRASIRARSPTSRCRWCSIRGFRLAGRPSGGRHQRQLGRAQDAASCGKSAASSLRVRHQHRRRSAAATRPALAAVRRRRRRRPPRRHGRGWRAQDLAARLRDRARARPGTTGHAQRGVSSTPSPGASNLHLAAGSKRPDELIADIDDGFYVTDMIGMGVNLVTGDYSRGATRFLDRERRAHLSGQRSHDRRTSVGMFASLDAGERSCLPLGTNAPTLRVEGMTVAGH